MKLYAINNCLHVLVNRNQGLSHTTSSPWKTQRSSSQDLEINTQQSTGEGGSTTEESTVIKRGNERVVIANDRVVLNSIQPSKINEPLLFLIFAPNKPFVRVIAS